MLLNFLKLQGIYTCWPLEPADELNDWGTNSLLSMRNIASLSGANFPVELIKIKKELKIPIQRKYLASENASLLNYYYN